MNHVVLVGRITNDLEKVEENGVAKVFLTIEVPRPFKNSGSIYEKDLIKCIVYNRIVERATEYCKKGDVVGIRGRLTSDYVIAERITFLKSEEVK